MGIMRVEGLRPGTMTQSSEDIEERFGSVTHHLKRESTIHVDILQGEKREVGALEISILIEETSILSRAPEVESIYPIKVVLRQIEEEIEDKYFIARRKMYAKPGSQLLSHTQSVKGGTPQRVSGIGDLAKYEAVINELLNNSGLGDMQKNRIDDVLCLIREGSN